MRKNIQAVIEATLKMVFHTWKISVVLATLLYILRLIGYVLPDQWHNFEIVSNIQLSLTQAVIMVAFVSGLFHHIVRDRAITDGYQWWRILGYVAGGVVGCIIVLLAREPIYSFTINGFLRGWTYFIAATFTFVALYGFLDEE